MKPIVAMIRDGRYGTLTTVVNGVPISFIKIEGDRPSEEDTE